MYSLNEIKAHKRHNTICQGHIVNVSSGQSMQKRQEPLDCTEDLRIFFRRCVQMDDPLQDKFP